MLFLYSKKKNVWFFQTIHFILQFAKKNIQVTPVTAGDVSIEYRVEIRFERTFSCCRVSRQNTVCKMELRNGESRSREGKRRRSRGKQTSTTKRIAI